MMDEPHDRDAMGVDYSQGPVEPMPPGRTPVWRSFDEAWYFRTYSETQADMLRAGIPTAEEYYHQIGARLGHSPNMFFDEAYYLETYPDVAAHVAVGGAPSGFSHYITDGFKGRSPHWLFDEHRYRSLYPDLGDPGSPPAGFANGYDHFLAHGDQEGRSGHRFFDPDLYRSSVAGSKDAESGLPPFATFLAIGGHVSPTARLSWYFDPVWYLRTYPEVANEIRGGMWSSALHHYLRNRMPWRYAPNAWFSEDFYTQTYPDVAHEIAAGTFRNGYDHFLRSGAMEGRAPHETVDLATYIARPRVRRALNAKQFFDGFAHMIAFSERQAFEAREDPEDLCKAVFLRKADHNLITLARHPLDFTVSDRPDVSVVMVVHDKFALTMTALASLRANFHGAIELLLVDSGSADQTRMIARWVKGAQVIRCEENVGFLLGCMEGFKRVTAPAMLLLNNDLLLGHRAVELAIRRLFMEKGIGAVGGKVVRTNGLLQEAGNIVWQNGTTVGYLRDTDPNIPEANFVRDVDFCSGVFLMVRSDCLRKLDGFDVAFAPAYYEETDFCTRLWQAGYRVVYDPAVVIEHLEYGTSGMSQTDDLIARNHGVFVRKHESWLHDKQPASPETLFRASRPGASHGRILFIEDQIPMRGLGAGFVRSNDVVTTMVTLGYDVSVFPLFPNTLVPAEMFAAFPDKAELLWNRTMDDLPEFLSERAGFYDLIWIGRTHNLDRLEPILDAATGQIPERGIILDTEALAAPRTVERANVLGLPEIEPLQALLRRELAPAQRCAQIVAVNVLDAELIRQSGLMPVSVLGHMQHARATTRPWQDRHGLLFLGALHDFDSPNYDSLAWFVRQVLPMLEAGLDTDLRVTVAGYVSPGLDLSALTHSRVDLIGAIDDPSELYDRHRLFIAPTRFAGGIPFKIHEAASCGLPVVASDLLCRQVGWTDGCEIVSGGTNDPAQFAASIARAYDDQQLWYRVRDEALARIAADHTPAAYEAQLQEIIERTMRDVRLAA